MEFTVFTMEMLAYLKKSMGEQFLLKVHSVRKNNGVELTGISFEEKGKNTSPTIYLNEFYERYYKEGMPIKEVADMIIQTYKECRLKCSVDMSDFMDYEKARKHIAVKVINYDQNKEALEQIPHKVRYHLAFVCYYFVDQEPFYGKAFIQIRQSHLRQWGVSFETVYRNALEYTVSAFPAQTESIESILESQMPNLWSGQRELPMYVLSNRQKLQGAVCMFYPGVLKKIADNMKKNLYVLPSSIHEVILLPQEEGIKPSELLRLVTRVNRTSVLRSEVLADAVYYYDRCKDEFTVFS